MKTKKRKKMSQHFDLLQSFLKQKKTLWFLCCHIHTIRPLALNFHCCHFFSLDLDICIAHTQKWLWFPHISGRCRCSTIPPDRFTLHFFKRKIQKWIATGNLVGNINWKLHWMMIHVFFFDIFWSCHCINNRQDLVCIYTI